MGTGCWTFPHGRDGALPTAPPMGDSSPESRLQQGHLGPRDPSSGLMVKNGSVAACPSTPKLSSHPGALRLHPTHSTLVPYPALRCPHGPQHREGQALAEEPSNLQHSFSLWINNPRPAVGPVGCSTGDSHELGHSQTTETHSSFSFTPLQL